MDGFVLICALKGNFIFIFLGVFPVLPGQQMENKSWE